MYRFLATLLLATSGVVFAGEPSYDRRELIYGRTFGTALTMDVFTPKKAANGAGIVFIVSEGWYSDHAKITPNIPAYVDPFIEKRYTVFAVCHGGNPKFALPEIVEQIHRAVRFIRHNAKEFGIEPDRIGVTGDSAGGHLSLMLGCTGREGDSKAEDAVERESSNVQAVVAYYPPTDFLNWGVDGKVMLGDHPSVPVQGAFDFVRPDPKTNALRLVTDVEQREEIGRQVSPITHVHKDAAPTLIIVGDQDELIPPQQSKAMAAKLKNAGATCELVVIPGGGHDELLIKAGGPQSLSWFNKYLLKKSSLKTE